MRRRNTMIDVDMNQQVLGYPNLEPRIFGYPPAFPHTNIPMLTAPVNMPNYDAHYSEEPYGNAISYITRQYYGASHHYPAGFAAAPVFCGSSQMASNGGLDGGISPWSQLVPTPYMHGSYIDAGSLEPENLSVQRHCHETFINGDSSMFVSPFGINPRHHSFTHHPPHPLISLTTSVFPHMSPDWSTGFTSYRNHHQQSSMELLPKHSNLPHLRLMPADEVALLEFGDFSEIGSHSDQHDGMRLDIEHMSYEDLLALSEGIGNVNTGLSQEAVMNHLKTRTHLTSETNLTDALTLDQETNTCIICQENYANQEKIGTLDCGHEYHADCLKKWLSVKNVCPICKCVALAPQKDLE